MTLNDPIDAAIEAVAGRVALIDGDRRITFGEVGHAIASAARVLAERGVGAGDRVALAAGAGLAGIATVLGCARLGAASAPMSTLLTAREVSALVETAGCGRVSVASGDASAAMREAVGEPILAEELFAWGTEARPLELHPVADDDIAVVLFTGGTTGSPKPVPLPHGTLERRVRSFAPPVDPSASPAVSIICVPFHHVAGLIGVLVGLAGGNTTVVQHRFGAREWLKLVEDHRVQRAFLVPTMLHRILEYPARAGADLSSLQMITYGAAPAAPDLIERAVKVFPNVAFINVFGQTETLGAVTALGPDDHRAGRAGSVGKAMPGVEVRIVDPATGGDVPDGEVGEFWVRAPFTASEGWVRSGDLVRRDSDGYLFAAGRLSDLINRGGEKIDPTEVEAVLRSHPAIEDAAVCGVLDAEMGERVGAVIVARGSVDDGAIRAWCRERLAPYKVPERFAFVDALPLTELGKVSRRDLRALLTDS
jgi:acyl-CoA synthetase (AMP-forming)/AMP-acid ligase II